VLDSREHGSVASQPPAEVDITLNLKLRLRRMELKSRE